jgi:pectate lyase
MMSEVVKRQIKIAGIVFSCVLFFLNFRMVDAFEGFGAGTSGGNNGSVYRVTNLNDSGAGSLRAGIGSNRKIVFDVSGTINLVSGNIEIRDMENITIDGASAPDKGITLMGNGITIRNSSDIIVTNLRIRNAKVDGITLWSGSRNVVLDHLSISGSMDGDIDITEDTQNVTVSWSIIGDLRPVSSSSKGMLIANFSQGPVTNVSLHHNLYHNKHQRSPQLSSPGLFDMRNNVIREWGSYGTRVRQGAYGNFVNNVYESQNDGKDALIFLEDAGGRYVAGNLSPAGFNVNSFSDRSIPFAAATVKTDDTALVKGIVLDSVGALPRDGIDREIVGLSVPTKKPTIMPTLPVASPTYYCVGACVTPTIAISPTVFIPVSIKPSISVTEISVSPTVSPTVIKLSPTQVPIEGDQGNFLQIILELIRAFLGFLFGILRLR